MTKEEINKVMNYAIGLLEAWDTIPADEPIDIADMSNTLELVFEVAKQLLKENQSLREVIKDNFGFTKGLGVYFAYNSPVNEEKIIKVLENELVRN